MAPLFENQFTSLTRDQKAKLNRFRVEMERLRRNESSLVEKENRVAALQHQKEQSKQLIEQRKELLREQSRIKFQEIQEKK